MEEIKSNYLKWRENDGNWYTWVLLNHSQGDIGLSPVSVGWVMGFVTQSSWTGGRTARIHACSRDATNAFNFLKSKEYKGIQRFFWALVQSDRYVKKTTCCLDTFWTHLDSKSNTKNDWLNYFFLSFFFFPETLPGSLTLNISSYWKESEKDAI